MGRIIENLNAFIDPRAARICADHLSAAIAFSGYVIFVCDDVGEDCAIQRMASYRLGVDFDPPTFLNAHYISMNSSSLRNELFAAQSQ